LSKNDDTLEEGKWLLLIPMDLQVLPNEQNFDVDKSRQKFHHKNFIFFWKRYQFPVRNTKWLKNGKLRKAILSAFYNILQRNFGILLILWCSFKLWWHFCLDLSTSKFCSLGNRSIKCYDQMRFT
jgi:hypothetical protein